MIWLQEWSFYQDENTSKKLKKILSRFLKSKGAFDQLILIELTKIREIKQDLVALDEKRFSKLIFD